MLPTEAAAKRKAVGASDSVLIRALHDPGLGRNKLLGGHAKLKQARHRGRETVQGHSSAPVSPRKLMAGACTHSLNQSPSSSAYALTHFLKLLSWVST